MRHRRYSVDPEFRCDVDLLVGERQARPHEVALLEHLHPVIFLDEHLEQLEFTPAATGVDLELLALFVLLVGVAVRVG